MATGNELCGTWRFLAQDNTNPECYPGDNFVTIGRQGGTFTMVWLDKSNHLRMISGLKLADIPRLEALHTTEKGSVNVTLGFGDSEIRGLIEPVRGSNGPGDPGLSGQWGADTPPPRPLDWILRILRWLGKRRRSGQP